MPGGAAQTRRSWTPGRSGRARAVPAGSPTCWSARPARSPGRWPSTCRGRAGRAARGDRRRPGRLRVLRGRDAAPARRDLLGAARLEIGHRCGLIDESAWSFLWVVDAPMFEEDGEGGWTSVTTRSPRRCPNGRTSSPPSPAVRWPTPTTSCATATRSAAARSVSTGSDDAAAGVRRDRPVRRGGPAPSSASCSTRSSRPAAARRHRLRLGPGDHAARRRRPASAT